MRHREKPCTIVEVSGQQEIEVKAGDWYEPKPERLMTVGGCRVPLRVASFLVKNGRAYVVPYATAERGVRPVLLDTIQKNYQRVPFADEKAEAVQLPLPATNEKPSRDLLDPLGEALAILEKEPEFGLSLGELERIGLLVSAAYGRRETTKDRAIAFFRKHPNVNATDVAKLLGVAPGTASAWKAHVTMGTYEAAE